jgi:hypothetical protein
LSQGRKPERDTTDRSMVSTRHQRSPPCRAMAVSISVRTWPSMRVPPGGILDQR